MYETLKNLYLTNQIDREELLRGMNYGWISQKQFNEIISEGEKVNVGTVVS